MKHKLWKKANKGLRIRYSPFTYQWYLEAKMAYNWAAIAKHSTVKGIIAKKHEEIRKRAYDYLSKRGII